MDKQTKFCITKGIILEMIVDKIREGDNKDKDMLLYFCNKITKMNYNESINENLTEAVIENLTEEPRFLIIKIASEETVDTCDTLPEAMQGYDYQTEYIFDTKTNVKVSRFNLGKLSL